MAIITIFTPNLWHVIRLIRVIQDFIPLYSLTNESSVPCMPSSSRCVVRLFSKHPGQAPMALVLPSGIFQLITYAQKFLPHLAAYVKSYWEAKELPKPDSTHGSHAAVTRKKYIKLIFLKTEQCSNRLESSWIKSQEYRMYLAKFYASISHGYFPHEISTKTSMQHLASASSGSSWTAPSRVCCASCRRPVNSKP